MSYLKADSQDTDKLRLPSDPDGEFYALMKKRAAYGDQLAAQSAVVQVLADSGQNGQPVTPDVDTAAYARTLITRLVVEWNLTDEAEQPLPITIENVERLYPEDGEFLATEAAKRVGQRTAEKQLPFKNGSGRPSTATPSAIQKSRAS
jgi:hypothetical protein